MYLFCFESCDKKKIGLTFRPSLSVILLILPVHHHRIYSMIVSAPYFYNIIMITVLCIIIDVMKKPPHIWTFFFHYQSHQSIDHRRDTKHMYNIMYKTTFLRYCIITYTMYSSSVIRRSSLHM